MKSQQVLRNRFLKELEALKIDFDYRYAKSKLALESLDLEREVPDYIDELLRGNETYVDPSRSSANQSNPLNENRLQLLEAYKWLEMYKPKT